MEMTKVETVVLQGATNDAIKGSISELNELQLALVGGGGGDVVFA